MQNENTFYDIATTASQLWGQLDEDAKKGFRERHQAMVRLRSKNQKLQALRVDVCHVSFISWHFNGVCEEHFFASDEIPDLLVLNDHYIGCVVARK